MRLYVAGQHREAKQRAHAPGQRMLHRHRAHRATWPPPNARTGPRSARVIAHSAGTTARLVSSRFPRRQHVQQPYRVQSGHVHTNREQMLQHLNAACFAGQMRGVAGNLLRAASTSACQMSRARCPQRPAHPAYLVSHRWVNPLAQRLHILQVASGCRGHELALEATLRRQHTKNRKTRNESGRHVSTEQSPRCACGAVGAGREPCPTNQL